MFFLTESGANVVRNFHIRKRKGKYLQIKKEKRVVAEGESLCNTPLFFIAWNAPDRRTFL